MHREPVHTPSPNSARSLIVPAAAILLAALALALATTYMRAETCITQSGMSEADRGSLSEAARTLAIKVQANDIAALRTSAIAEMQKDFSAFQYLVGSTAPKLAGATPIVEQVYLLDASSLKPNADGTATDAQFFCSLNRSTSEADFTIPALPSGKYGFTIVNVGGAPSPAQAATSAAQPAPWRLSFLLRQEQGRWLLAGFYPKPLTASGHDGLWYWTHARESVKAKQPWDAWLYYQAATMLLSPADFVMSSHLDKLRTEATAAAPPALSAGLGPDAPLVVKAANGTEYRFTSLSVDDSLGQPNLDIAAHLRVDPLADLAAARKRNGDAMAALLAAYPEMRQPFHGVWIYADSPGQRPFATEQPMAEIK